MQQEATKKFGTFSGVFLPSVLAILGAVMYYIAPKVVGGVGLVNTIIIIIIAHSVTIATAFSISAIATNINVKGGGLYYLISRSLGSEFGGSLGIQLFLAQTIASSFYAIAFARGISSILSSLGYGLQEMQIAFLSLLIFGIIVFIGARFVIKIQFAILAAIALSLFSIFFAPASQNIAITFFSTATIPFWVAFAMFFPAVTGIDAGVGMSGELKNPRKSLVKGTFTAIIITMVIYIAIVIKYAISASPDELVSNPYIVQSLALFPQLVLLGVLMATSSSALSSLMTAPRCLSAMVEDRILPKGLRFLGKKSGKHSEPRIAIIFSLLIGLAIIMLGNLEFVSQIVSMFFLSVYGWINGAAFFEKISKNPSYRPLFNPPAIISLYGMLAAYAIMYLFSLKVLIIVILIQGLLFFWLYKSKKSMKLESVWDGVFFQLLRSLMRRMDATEKSKKNWRPTILAFCANDLNKTPIANMLHWVSSRRSFTKLYFLKQGDLKNNCKEREKLEQSLTTYIKEYNLDVFPKILLSEDFEETISSLMQSEAIGNLPLNTVMVDFDKQIKIDKLISDMVVLKKNIIFLRNQSGFAEFKKIDVWWSSEKNGNFMLLLAYLISHSKKWLESDSSIRIFKIIENNENKAEQEQKMQRIIEESRIENAELHIIEPKKEELKDIINSQSENSDLVLLGIPHFLERKDDNDVIETINHYTEKLKVSLLVLANDKIDFKIN